MTAWHLWSALVNQASLHFLKLYIHFFFMSIVVLSVYLLLSFECWIKFTAAVNTRTIMFHLITILFSKRAHYPKWITITRTWSSLVVPMLLNTSCTLWGCSEETKIICLIDKSAKHFFNSGNMHVNVHKYDKSTDWKCCVHTRKHTHSQLVCFSNDSSVKRCASFYTGPCREPRPHCPIWMKNPLNP